MNEQHARMVRGGAWAIDAYRKHQQVPVLDLRKMGFFPDKEKERLTLQALDLSNADLSRTIFKNCNLLGLDFSGALLGSALFENCTFRHCTFRETYLDKAKFYRSQLIDIDFSDAVRMNGKFKDVFFHTIRLSGAKLTGVSFIRTEFVNIEMDAEQMREPWAEPIPRTAISMADERHDSETEDDVVQPSTKQQPH